MNEPIQDGLRDALRRLREDAAGKSASPALKANLVHAFRAQHAAKAPQRRRWMWVPAAIAASLVLAAVSRLSEPTKLEAPSVPLASYPSAKPPAAPNSEGSIVAAAAEKPRRKPAARRPRPAAHPLSVASAKPKGEAEPFVQIPYAPPFTQYDEGQILRVNMAGSSARRMGLPVTAGSVQADLLVGNDGLPRAVRLVSHTPNRF